MEVRLCVKMYTDISLIEAEYGGLGEPYSRNDEENLVDYYLGCDDEDDDEDDDEGEWLTYDQTVGFCGFCDGAIPDSIPWIMGNGEWAQSMIARRDFSSCAMTINDKSERLRISEVYWDYRSKGAALSLAKSNAPNDRPSDEV